MRKYWAVVSCVILAACGSEVATPASGVGFGSYDEYLSERERAAAERERQISAGMIVSPESSVSADVTFQSDRPAPAPVEVVQAPVSAPATTPVEPIVDTLAQEQAVTPVATNDTPVDPNNPNISDEQNFDAVSSRESIESDRERLEKQREQFQVIEPTALPKRRGSDTPNIVVYALSTTNPVGQSLYPRGPFKNANATKRNCDKFVFEDLAQEAFLAAGGPERDPKRLDPDGDGFACDWDPTPFRVVRK